MSHITTKQTFLKMRTTMIGIRCCNIQELRNQFEVLPNKMLLIDENNGYNIII